MRAPAACRSGGRRRPLVGTAVLATLLAAAACTSQVTGAPESGGPAAGLPAGAAAVLDRIPATAATKRYVVITDPAVLSRVDQRTRLTGTAQTGRPLADVGYLDALPLTDGCAVLDDRNDPLRGSRPGTAVTVAADRAGSEQDGATVSVCGGAADPALLARNLDDGDSREATVDGVAGRQTDDEFVGIDSAGDRTLVRRGDADPAVVTAAVSGSAADGSLLRDPDVTTALAAAPGAAFVVLGTDLLGAPRAGAAGSVVRALDRAVAQAGGGPPPVPEFAGTAWLPGDRVVGSTVFVTSYGSDEEAARAAALFSAVWQELGESRYTGASTRQQGSWVVTTVPETGPGSFEFSDRRVKDYPGFLARG